MTHNVTFVWYSAVLGTLSHQKYNWKNCEYKKLIQSTLQEETYKWCDKMAEFKNFETE